MELPIGVFEIARNFLSIKVNAIGFNIFSIHVADTSAAVSPSYFAVNETDRTVML